MSETELLSNEQLAVNSENKNLQSQLLNISGKKSTHNFKNYNFLMHSVLFITIFILSSGTALWKDNYAVKTLIEEWRGHESYFKSTTITNKKVWDMIANKLKKENPLWDYTGQQCEDKFKDLRKQYVKARDHNEKSSGLPVVTCKFYEEMDDALGDKPSMKPVSIASTLKKRNQSSSLDSSSTASVFVGSNSEDNDSEHSCDSIPKSKKKKKSITERNIERLITIRTEESKKKEEARQKRHTERLERQNRAIEVYQDAMNRLLEKL